jgi:hypothetical protein
VVADIALASFSCVSLTVELVGSVVDSASDTLLELKSAAIVVLGNELNKDVVFAVFVSCVDGVKEGNQEIGFSFANDEFELVPELEYSKPFEPRPTVLTMLICHCDTMFTSQSSRM